ncbi:hypothetical protein EX30DRAFT_314482 [Ascodesmis nigricans]|uniref:CHCH domain-containing protein n=1 Tax=Ascodesmis nigricans TaxID=341454 RepID=A0A4S2N8B4_9PEZI|nr:hypothetical protein EX30DRAFT_314482 [Ascodesmis nigricans]
MAASTDATTDAAPTKDRRAVPAEFIKSFPLSTETGTPDAKASKDGATMGDNNNGEGAEGSTEFGKSKRKFMGKARSEYFDPCQEAASRSLRCLARNQQDKEICNDYFKAYRDCKKQFLLDLKEEKKRLRGW